MVVGIEIESQSRVRLSRRSFLTRVRSLVLQDLLTSSPHPALRAQTAVHHPHRPRVEATPVIVAIVRRRSCREQCCRLRA